MNQCEFYELPEVQEQLEIQKQNPFGSKAHRNAYFQIGDIAKKVGVWDEYTAAGGGEYE